MLREPLPVAQVTTKMVNYIEKCRLNVKSTKKGDRSLNRPPFGAPLGIRTLDPLIKSQLLYQLS